MPKFGDKHTESEISDKFQDYGMALTQDKYEQCFRIALCAGASICMCRVCQDRYKKEQSND